MKKLFIPYIMGERGFIKNLQLLSEQGADIVEIGVPFSDPVADGPTIMEAGSKSIAEGVTLDFILRELKQNQSVHNTKYVLMTYYNIIHHYGERRFIKACESAGVYGVIIPDLPYELLERMKLAYPERQLKLISLIAMTTSDERIQKICRSAEGFIYTVTMNATTGDHGAFHPELKARIQYIQSQTDLPVTAGFGIRTADDIKDICEVADGVVIGSEIVRRLNTQSTAEFINYLKDIRHTLDQC